MTQVITTYNMTLTTRMRVETDNSADEPVIHISFGVYRARVVCGRVWRWQAGDEREPARLMGRCKKDHDAALLQCALALKLLEQSDLASDAPGYPAQTVHVPLAQARAAADRLAGEGWLEADEALAAYVSDDMARHVQ